MAAEGYAPAQFELGRAYFYGEGKRKDLEKAYDLMRAAADQGYPSAIGFVGIFYVQVSPPLGVIDLNPAEGCAWFEKAALAGNSGAQFNLAQAYETGNGVPQSAALAYVWARLAVKCNPIRSRMAEVLRDRCAQKLNAEERAEADQKIAHLGKDIPTERSEHSVYWKACARRAGIEV